MEIGSLLREVELYKELANDSVLFLQKPGVHSAVDNLRDFLQLQRVGDLRRLLRVVVQLRVHVFPSVDPRDFRRGPLLHQKQGGHAVRESNEGSKHRERHSAAVLPEPVLHRLAEQVLQHEGDSHVVGHWVYLGSGLFFNRGQFHGL